MELILASNSPRRRELLGRFHLPFTVAVSHADESMDPCLSPEQAVAQVSRRKAQAVDAPQALVLAADTIVVLEGRILGKPRDERDAADMLRSLSGREHQVITGVTLKHGDMLTTKTETTRVWFRSLTDAEIAAYVATGEPLDKAGAYGIQGGASLFIPRIQGDYCNVMGLPLCLLGSMLEAYGIHLLGDIQ